MNCFKMIGLFLFLSTWISAQPKEALNKITKQAFIIGESLEFDSEVLGERRRINVYLPHNYHPDSTKSYPVIYLLDGSVEEDFIHIAGLVQFGSFSWINMLPESIIIGIANVDRKRDFTYPTSVKEDKNDFPTTGGSEKFIAFLKEELQPLVETQYKTNLSRTIIGQSLGGLLASEVLLKEPALFDNYIIISPSLWWDKESLLEWEIGAFQSKKSIYIGVGKEGEVMERVAKSLYEKLGALKRKNAKLYYGFFEQQNHGDALHLAVYDAFEKIFKKEK